MRKSVYQVISLVLAAVFAASPIAAQTKRPNPPKRQRAVEVAVPEPVPTFDSLLAAGSYKVYSEIRNVGGLVQSPALNELLEPLIKIGKPPPEFNSLLKWINAHADQLVGSRMMAASWPSRPTLPFVLMAVEFASAEDAKKFFPALRDFLPTLLPTPTPAESPAPGEKPTAAMGVRRSDGTLAAAEAPSGPPYHLKQTGSLLLISSTPFDLRSLRPRGSLALEEDQGFITARSRFASEALFVFVDLKSIENEEKERQKKWEEEDKKRIEAERANPPKVQELQTEREPDAEKELAPPPVVEPSIAADPVVVEPKSNAQTPHPGTLSAGPAPEIGPSLFPFSMLLGGGRTKWPDALGAALVLEGDAYVVRTLLINRDEHKNRPIPFVPLFVSGPAIAPESPNVFPADANLFVSVSLDYAQIYEEMLKTIADMSVMSRRYTRQPNAEAPPPESPFADYEKKLGLKIKDDLLPLLGNEIALVLLRKPQVAPPDAATSGPNKTEPKQTRPPDPIPVVAIAVKDREAVKRLIPKVIEALGFKGANVIAQTEKRDSTELTSYAGTFAYAFIDDFLVISADAAETRKVVDAYLNHQTLASDSSFRNFTRWQPRQVQGQVYVAGGMVDEFTSGLFRGGMPANDKYYDALSRLSPVIDPMTYSLSNDGGGPLHELHVPKTLLQLLLAGAGSQSKPTLLQNNESMAQMCLHAIASSEASLKSDGGNYGTLDQLISKGFLSKEMFENRGYTFLVSLSANKFEAVAIPVEYGKTGRRSFFIDETGVLRAGDHGGGAATASDDPIGSW